MQFRPSWRIAWILVATVLPLLFASCSREVAPLHVALNPWPGYAFLFLAQERGYFADEGLDVRLVELLSLGDVRRAFEHRHVEIMASSIVEPILLAESAKSAPRIIHICDASNGSDVLLGQPSVTSLNDLVGGRIGYESMSVDVIGVYAALQHASIDVSQVTLVPMPQAELASAFRSGDLTAIQCYPPISTQLTAQTNCTRLFDSSGNRTTVYDCLTATHEVLQERPEDIQKFMHAYHRAVQDYIANRQEAIEIMSRRTGMSEEDFHGSLDGLIAYDLEPDRLPPDKPSMKAAVVRAHQALDSSPDLELSQTAETIAETILEFYSPTP
ncbi:MAG: ABC transporter substrate-binding protein [Planctomycetales bacterium]|nr:ABC transporter substrate-binding protein [Planctomycetales bacterium]MCA9167543.1 ABC transporter substrate-binding protein [Planctomycetales bacterium]